MNGWNPRTGHVVAFLDLGTNSLRMLVVRINPNFSYTVISQEKEAVRLGEGEFADQTLRREAIDRAVLVAKKFTDLAKTYGADEIIAVATSAAREATNQNVLLDRMRSEAGLELGVISGMEEARLVYLGVASGIDLSGRTALFIDIGGGSTELVLGDQANYSHLDSFKLGAIRLTNMFVPDGNTGPIEDAVYSKMKRHVRGLTIHTVQAVGGRKFDLVIGSSGTIVNLAEMAARNFDGKPGTLRLAQLKKLTALLRSLPLKERRQVPGMNPERADIILGGAAILETLMEELGIESLSICDRGVQNGMLIDYLSKVEGYPNAGEMSVREASVLQLGRSCNFDERHAETVVRLALQLFDSAKVIGLHDLGNKERELLKYAAYLHDVGDFISFTNHHAHSYYIVRNADLLGFAEWEIAVMANLVRYHRKRPPRRKDPEMAGLDERQRRMVITLSMFLRLAETLDRSHADLVKEIDLKKGEKGEIVLGVVTEADPSLEVWGAEGSGKAFRRAFDKELRVEVERPAPFVLN
jgi:exopolyphosphatase/guanosine-5'-triphosphate,3'-diphosphate pyrophosphatase